LERTKPKTNHALPTHACNNYQIRRTRAKVKWNNKEAKPETKACNNIGPSIEELEAAGTAGTWQQHSSDSFPGAETTGLGSEVAGEGESKSPARWG
jgi:hypothetical protein